MDRPGVLPLFKTQNSYHNMTKEVISIKEAKVLMHFTVPTKDNWIRCNKLLLAIYSPYVRNMLTANMDEVTKQEVRLKHISTDVMNIVLWYMYHDNVSFEKDQLMNLIFAADYLVSTNDGTEADVCGKNSINPGTSKCHYMVENSKQN